MNIHKIILAEKFSLINEHWRPKVIGSLNGQEVKAVKFKGNFIWHHHVSEDELFLCIRGKMRIELHESSIELSPGEMVIIPHSVEHRTSADEEAEVLIFEPAATRNTGNVRDDHFTAPDSMPL